MGTKTFFFTALLGLATSTPLLAQSTNVYSDNAVGVVQQVYQPGQFQMICNPLNTTNNTLGSLMPSMPNGTSIFKWNGASYVSSTFLFGSWSQPALTLNPGEGCFIKVGGSAPYTNIWAGEIMQGMLTNNFAVGFSIVSSKVPQEADAVTLGLLCSPANGDAIYKYNPATGTYSSATFLFGSWNPSPPTIAVGEAVFLKSSTGHSCVRNFSIDN